MRELIAVAARAHCLSADTRARTLTQHCTFNRWTTNTTKCITDTLSSARMAGILFIVTIPRKEHETNLRNQLKLDQNTPENHDSAAKIVQGIRENEMFSAKKPPMGSYIRGDGDKSEHMVNMFKCKDQDIKENEHNILRYSWNDLKQAVKRKNKISITRPSRGLDLLGGVHGDTPQETLLADLLVQIENNNAVWITTNHLFWQVTFSMETSNLCEELLEVLRIFGIGTRFQSSISVVPCSLYYESKQEQTTSHRYVHRSSKSSRSSVWSQLWSSVNSRCNLSQVLQDVRKEAELTFDWLFLLVVAAFVAAIGLVEDSTVILVASMLISPLMGPITAGTLGTAVRDRTLQRIGIAHELLGLFLSLIIGFLIGITICAIDEHYGVGDWPTREMISRCEIRSLWIGVLVAVPSGAGVALSVLNENTASLVGVAISASLLPPAVNAGLLWSMSLVHLLFANETRWTKLVQSAVYSNNKAVELALMGSVSLCLTLVNIVCIFVVGVFIYKIKKVGPLEKRDLSWCRSTKNLMRGSKKQTKFVSTNIGCTKGNSPRTDTGSKNSSERRFPNNVNFTGGSTFLRESYKRFETSLEKQNSFMSHTYISFADPEKDSHTNLGYSETDSTAIVLETSPEMAKDFGIVLQSKSYHV